MNTDLDNFQAITENRRPRQILYYAELTEDLHRRVSEHIGGSDYSKHYGFFNWVHLSLTRPAGRPPIDYQSYWKGEDLPQNATINSLGVAEVPSGFHHFWGYVSPLRNAATLSEIENYPLDDLSDWDDSSIAAKVAKAHAHGEVTMGFVGHMYESAWQIRGYEQFLIDMIDQPAWAECLLDRIAEQNRIKCLAFARASVDMIHCCDDVANQNGTMFSSKMWRKMIHSRWAKIWQAVKEVNSKIKIWYHSDGNITDLLPDLIDAGVDILNPVQPECLDIDAIYREYGRHVTFDGLIGTQTTMPFGSPNQVRDRVREVIDKYGQNGGLILSPTHVLEPDVTVANVEAFAEACRTYGKFD